MIKTQLSRRKYFEYLRDGKIKVNGKVIEDINMRFKNQKIKWLSMERLFLFMDRLIIIYTISPKGVIDNDRSKDPMYW